jgi:hypothetical protein
MRRIRLVADCTDVAPALGALDSICRLKLDARRAGCTLELRNVRPSLLELFDLAGLAELLVGEGERQAEQREDPRRVEEERDLGDPPVL